MLSFRTPKSFRSSAILTKQTEKEEEDARVTYRTKGIFRLEHFRKKEECSVKTLYEKHGDLYIFEKFGKILISTIRMVNFQMKKETFSKGKLKLEIPFDQKSIPDLKFWFNRYYYFSKFDEGIQMDYESKFPVIKAGIQ
jgi:hypothetical protein